MAYRGHVTAALLILSTAACSGSDGAPEVSDARQLAHVELFGYYGSSPHLDEVLPYSNMVWGGIAAAAAARAAGVRAVVNVEQVFKVAAAVGPTPEAIEVEWRKAAERLAPDLSAVAALYVSDEPYWNGYRNGVPFVEVQRRLEEAARTIRATPGFEHVPLAIILADPELDWMASGDAVNPAGYDWIGWDLYGAPILILQLRAELFLSQLRPEQRVIAVPDAMLPLWITDDLAALDRRVEFWLSWVAATPRVVAIAPFIYATNSSPTTQWIGARDIPSVRDRYAEIGRWIVDTNLARAREAASSEASAAGR